MTKIGPLSANIPSLAPFLATASRGETLELCPSGSWRAIHANELEDFFDVALPKLQQATTLKVDMTTLRQPVVYWTGVIQFQLVAFDVSGGFSQTPDPWP